MWERDVSVAIAIQIDALTRSGCSPSPFREITPIRVSQVLILRHLAAGALAGVGWLPIRRDNAVADLVPHR